MAANYDRPKPVDTVSYRAYWWLNVTCQCGHQASAMISDLARRHRLAPTTRLWEVTERLRCTRCQERRPSIAVAQNPITPIA